MASIGNISNSLMEQLLPSFGNKRIATPIWNESQQMFITEQYTSAAGHLYYLGVRITDRFVTILHVGLYHSWTYINDVEVYAFNGTDKVLVGKDSLDTYYDESLIRSTTERLIKEYLVSQMKIQGASYDQEVLDADVKEIVQKSYCSMKQSTDTYKKMEAIKPLLLPRD